MRRARPILAAASLGLLTTLATTWALAAWMPFAMYPRHAARYFIAGDRPWSAAERTVRGVHHIWWHELGVSTMSPPNQNAAERHVPGTPDEWIALARVGHGSQLALRDGPPRWGTLARGGAPDPSVTAGTDHAFGWPMPALWYQVTGVYTANRATATALDGGIMLTPRTTLELRGSDFRALPLRPVWSGLLIDTALYAALWSLVLFAPGPARRALRRRRGLCPRCAYNLRGLPPGAPCSECGQQG